ncbi:MAG TPA: hypothetical protein VEC93_14600 [Anaerolineae bacterium]|nr:hypothetical protein [Anaerolineae bacterium]
MLPPQYKGQIGTKIQSLPLFIVVKEKFHVTSTVFGPRRTSDEDAPKLEATQRDSRQHHHAEHFKRPEVGRGRIGAGNHDNPQYAGQSPVWPRLARYGWQ